MGYGKMSTLTYWILTPEFWLIAGILLIVVDFTIGAALFLLPIGLAAILMACILFAQEGLWFGDVVFLDTWRQIIIWFSLLSVAFVGVIKFLFQRVRRGQADINEYE